MPLLIGGTIFLNYWAVSENKMLKWAESFRKKYSHTPQWLHRRFQTFQPSTKLLKSTGFLSERRIEYFLNSKSWHNTLLLNFKHQIVTSFHTCLQRNVTWEWITKHTIDYLWSKFLSEPIETDSPLHVQLWLMLYFYSPWIDLKGRLALQIKSCSFPLSWQERKRGILLFFLKALNLGIVCWLPTLLDFSCSEPLPEKPRPIQLPSLWSG